MSSWAAGYVSDLPYTYGFYHNMSPHHLALVALSRGIRGPDPNQPLTYCELGCGQGFTANLLAAANPNIHLYANDYNPAHIVEAQTLAEKSGLSNAHFFEHSFEDFLDQQLPKFDVITCHGIFSWVSPENRRLIVEFAKRFLKPGGLFYLSYNALPGWAGGTPLQYLINLHATSQGGPSAKGAVSALGFINRLQAADARYFRNATVKARLKNLANKQSNYIVHEYINDNWKAFYHNEIAYELDKAKLTFIGSADILNDIVRINLTAEQEEILLAIDNPSLKETVRDYMTNTQFRSDIYVKGAVRLSPEENESRWRKMRFALATPLEDIPMTVKGALGETELSEAVYEPILESLSKGPRSVDSLLEVEEIAKLGSEPLSQALLVLVGAEHLYPCCSEEDDEARTERTRSFNSCVLEQAAHYERLYCLASPKTGSGVKTDRISQLFILAGELEQSDPPLAVWHLLNRHGQALKRDGIGLKGQEANVAELRRRYDRFLSKDITVLRNLGVV